jgi:Carboxypeptidase regulatory-like domain
MTINAVRCAGILLLCISMPVYIFGQINAIAGGTVTDATGALIPGVEVTARNVNTGIVTTRITNETGTYELPSLQPGVYALSAALSGFQTAIYNNVQLSQGQQVRLNFTLRVASVAQAVEVVAEANTLLATTTASVGNVLPEVEVRSLPLMSRNVLDLYRTAMP